MLPRRIVSFCSRSVYQATLDSRHTQRSFVLPSPLFRVCGTVRLLHHRIELPQLLPASSCSQSIRHVSNSPSDTDLSKHPLHHPEKGKLIYVGTVSSMVKAIKIFSLSTSALGLAMQPFIFANADKLPAVLRVVLVGTVSFFVVLTPLLLHWITGRYVTEMHYDALSATYTANTYSLFVTTKEHKFTLMDVEHLELPGLLTTIRVNKKPLFFDPDLFIDKKACIKLLGYDKPINWSYPSEKDGKKKL